MEWADWQPTAEAIRAEFGYGEQADLAAALALRDLLAPGPVWRGLGVQVRNRRNLAVVGCGPSLERVPAAALAGQVVVAADGACTWLRESGLVPHVVVSDLDGKAEDLAWAAAQGATMVVHAHGDNRAALAALVPRLGPIVAGTHQVPPRPELEPLRNPGGFTDGDRAVVLLEALGGRACTLYGFDFDQPPSRYSHKWDPATKMRKLAWAERIVAGVVARGRLAVQRYVP
jgi:hypothetical protein